MNVAPERGESKHLFGKAIDIEQVFVVGWPRGEQMFEHTVRPDGRSAGVTTATYNVHDTDARIGARTNERKEPLMTSLLTAPLPEYLDDQPFRPGRPELRLVQAPERRGLRHRAVEEADDWAPAPLRIPRRRVRRRRTLLAMMGLALALLAFPLGGFGGASHTTESASAVQIHPGSYIVRAGDTLWSIAQRTDPTGDPRPMVSQLAAEIGSYNLVPGERVVIP
jgi:hypothetical protein